MTAWTQVDPVRAADQWNLTRMVLGSDIEWRSLAESSNFGNQLLRAFLLFIVQDRPSPRTDNRYRLREHSSKSRARIVERSMHRLYM